LKYTYDAGGRIDTVTGSGGYVWGKTYVQMGSANKIATETLGGVYTFLSQQYDEYGRLIQTTDRNSVTVTNAFAALHRLSQRRMPTWRPYPKAKPTRRPGIMTNTAVLPTRSTRART